jgi:hypothetical protein
MTTRTESAQKIDPHVSSPQELACELNNTLSFQQEETLLRVSGIFRDKKREKKYGGFTYDALLDMTTQQSLTLMMPIRIKERLRDGRAYVFRGYLQRKISGGEMMNIEVTFRVSGVEDLDLHRSRKYSSSAATSSTPSVHEDSSESRVLSWTGCAPVTLSA